MAPNLTIDQAVLAGVFTAKPCSFEQNPVKWVKHSFSLIPTGALTSAAPKQKEYHRFPKHIIRNLKLLCQDKDGVVGRVPEERFISKKPYTRAFEAWLAYAESQILQIKKRKSPEDVQRLYALGLLARSKGATSLEDVVELVKKHSYAVRHVQVFRCNDMPVIITQPVNRYSHQFFFAPIEKCGWLIFGGMPLSADGVFRMWENHMERMDSAAPDSLMFSVGAASKVLRLDTEKRNRDLRKKMAVVGRKVYNLNFELKRLEDEFVVKGSALVKAESKLMAVSEGIVAGAVNPATVSAQQEKVRLKREVTGILERQRSVRESLKRSRRELNQTRQLILG